MEAIIFTLGTLFVLSIIYIVSLNFKVSKLKRKFIFLSEDEKLKIIKTEEYNENIKKLLKEETAIQKRIVKLNDELYPLNQEEIISKLKAPVIFLGGKQDFDIYPEKEYLTIQDGDGKVHFFEDKINKMRPKFKSISIAATSNGGYWVEKGTILFG